MSKPRKHIIVTVSKFIVFHWVCRNCGEPNASKISTTTDKDVFDCAHCHDCLVLNVTIKQFAFDYRQL